ncbi:Chromosome partition protein Smc [Carpediemonas membranifera]|uniref:Chromosome partition protein Smc n=1 Tax=Carpediemonas membranifera TaxID=201153 RepID=A0A8J6E0M3_9EUKA|nr:Chromosome partition protein Smc [Carpediemonas membranifera]|eukprot:KAG9389527.1 Chromosome partition protein Smc [Carpediemonas membranifera]
MAAQLGTQGPSENNPAFNIPDYSMGPPESDEEEPGVLSLHELDRASPPQSVAGFSSTMPRDIARSYMTRATPDDISSKMYFKTLDTENRLLRTQLGRYRSVEGEYHQQLEAEKTAHAQTKREYEAKHTRAVRTLERRVQESESAASTRIAELEAEVSRLNEALAEQRDQRGQTEASLQTNASTISDCTKLALALTDGVRALQRETLPSFNPASVNPAPLVELADSSSDSDFARVMVNLSQSLGLLKLTVETKIKTGVIIRDQIREDLKTAQKAETSVRAELTSAKEKTVALCAKHDADKRQFQTEFEQLTRLYERDRVAMAKELRKATEELEAATAAKDDAVRDANEAMAKTERVKSEMEALTVSHEGDSGARARLLAELDSTRAQRDKLQLEINGLKSSQKYSHTGSRGLEDMVDRLNRQVTTLTEDNARLAEAAKGLRLARRREASARSSGAFMCRGDEDEMAARMLTETLRSR